ncbi:MAG: sigma-70 family RNA polymerase sigma factor [Planctomycetes bacterium]|nr:sigma-70 family RNA polymerase sigma factor [Planctomycetota bacterium]
MGERPTARRPLGPDERAVLDALVHTVGPRLRAYVRRAYGTAFEVDEVVAETFCRAAANMEALLRCERQDMYLLTIARNLCRDGFRRTRPEALPGERLDQRSSDGPAPSEAADRRERNRALLEALEALPQSQREIVVLRLSAELKFEEIAELLKIPLGTALSRMHAAVQRLRGQLRCVYER